MPLILRSLNLTPHLQSLLALRQSKTVRTVAAFTTGNTVAMALGMAGSLVQAHYVGPEDWGVFLTFGVVAGYLTFFHLGVFDGLQREIPIQLGRGNPAKAERAASACLTWITFISLVGVALFLGLALQAACSDDKQHWMRFWGWLTYTPGIIAMFYGGYLNTTFRTGQQFVALSKTSVIQSVAGTATLPLLPFLGYYGVCLRTAASSVAGLFFLHRWRPMRVRPRFDWPDFWEVIRIGLPLSGIGYIYTALWSSVEGTLVLMWFGDKQLGLFAFAVFVRTTVAQLAQNMNQVLSVKVYEQYGRTHRVEDCLRLILKPLALACLASIPLIAVGWFLLPWVVRFLTPKFVDAILMAQLMLLMLPITFLRLFGSILWATGRRIYCLVPVVAGFLAFVGCSWLLHRLHVGVLSGVLSVAIGSMAGVIVNILGFCVVIWLLIGQERQTQRATD